MADDGYDGSVVLITPTDFATLSLLRGTDEQFARNDPLSGFRFVQSNSIAEGAPMLVDPNSSVRLYRGALSLSRHEQDAGQTNLSTVYLEEPFLAAVERSRAIRRRRVLT
jgi:hypothetical protein